MARKKLAGTVRTVGFTGTRRALPLKQRRALEKLLQQLQPLEVHHGDCIGADAWFHQAVRKALPEARIIIHPCHIHSLRAFCDGDGELPEKAPLRRNHCIVHSSQLMLAAPAGFHSRWRSGTWATIRYAHRSGKPVCLVYPDGAVVLHAGSGQTSLPGTLLVP